MALIKGITVVLHDKTQNGTDPFNRPVYTETSVNVDNVLVEPLSQDDIVNELNLTGKKAVYRLCIPKGDAHVWMDKKVTFFGEDWHVYGYPIEYIEDNVPLEWNRKVMVERYG